MSLHALEGHEAIRHAIAGSFRRGRLPPVLLLHGPAGVGKQRMGIWIGQLVLCEETGDRSPCGRCRGCMLANRIEHPDLHWYLPVRRPPARGSAERDREALEEARGARLAQLRAQPLHASHSEEVRGIHLATVRNLHREAARRPGMGPRRLFLVADAEELVAQESSEGAANAMLKLLEEPPPDTWFVLTSSEPGRLLPTVRSRATAIHVPPLPRSRVRDFLRRERDVPDEAIERAVALAGGSIGRALGYLPEGDEAGPLERVRREAFQLLKSVVDPRRGDRFALALATGTQGARGLREVLSSLEGWIRDLAVVGCSEGTPLLNRDGRDWLSRIAREREIHPARAARSIELVEAARTRAAGNVNPQLLLTGLLADLYAELADHPRSARSQRTSEEP